MKNPNTLVVIVQWSSVAIIVVCPSQAQENASSYAEWIRNKAYGWAYKNQEASVEDKEFARGSDSSGMCFI